jgi:hypothetical protein
MTEDTKEELREELIVNDFKKGDYFRSADPRREIFIELHGRNGSAGSSGPTTQPQSVGSSPHTDQPQSVGSSRPTTQPQSVGSSRPTTQPQPFGSSKKDSKPQKQ